MSAVAMPRLSDSMEEGTIVAWLLADGAEVAAGQPLVEIETDKATMTYEAEASGRLRIGAATGETVAVGSPIATIGEAEPAPAAERPKASPLARRIARQRGLDLAGLTGSGPGGRIVKADVLALDGAGAAPDRDAAVEASPGPPAAAPPSEPAAPEPSEGARGSSSRRELSRVQRVVARRMAEAKATIPEFLAEIEVEMDAALALRAALKEEMEGGADPVPSINDLLVKACAGVLREQPRLNSSFEEGSIRTYDQVNVGVAVAAEDSLVVPTIFEADRISLGEVARRSRHLADAVRGGAVTAPELAGGTFTVSNLGMFGLDAFTAIVNPPQAAILAVGAVARRPVARGEELAVASVARLTLSCDHRVAYGADAARFLARLKDFLEKPMLIVGS